MHHYQFEYNVVLKTSDNPLIGMNMIKVGGFDQKLGIVVTKFRIEGYDQILNYSL